MTAPLLEIFLRTATTVTITTTPQLILPSRSNDERAYMSLFNKDAANTVMFASDLEYNSGSFSTSTSGRPIYAQTEYWEEPGGVPGNAFYAWTLSGTALLNIQEG